MESMGLSDSLQGAFSGKRVFITGHTGFKGSWLTSYLHCLDAKLKGYSLEAEPQSLYRSLQADRFIESVTADVLDSDRLKQEMLSFEPDYVFHLAAQSLVIEGYKAPAHTYAVNVQGTVNVLEAVRELTSPCHTVVVTTDKVYANQEQGRPFQEDDALGGHDPYSASKACAELVVDSFRSSYFPVEDYTVHGKTLATARAGNIVGGGDWSENRLMPDAIRALSKEQAIEIRNPDAVRPWQHVLDPLTGYLMLATELASGKGLEIWSGAWNFGPRESQDMSVRELVEQVIEAWGQGSCIHSADKGPREAHLLRLDCGKAENRLGWKPKMSQREAIEHTVAWYKSVLLQGDSAEATIDRQIAQYLDSA